ncbi:MAG: hypothetical protein ACOY5Y_08365 [Pseudomonadota bacterium]
MTSNAHEPVSVLSAIELIRLRPAMFFGDCGPFMSDLVGLVVQDAFASGATKIEVVSEGDLVVVSADVDWMGHIGLSLQELFSRFTNPYGALRPNSHRSEVLIAAIAEGYFTDGEAGKFASNFSTDGLPRRIMASIGDGARSFAWRYSVPKGGTWTDHAFSA